MAEDLKSFFSETPILIWLSVLSFGVMLECIGTNAEKLHTFGNYWFKFKYMILYLVVIFLFLQPLSVIKDGLYNILDFGRLPSHTLSSEHGFIVTIKDVVLLIIVSDFFSYWWHRAQHCVDWLWDMHAVHHSDDEMNVLSGVRTHWTAFMFELFVTVLPTSLILGPTRNEIYALTGFITSLSLLTHANLKICFGKYTPIIAGPQFHRVHHSIYAHHHNKNFAAIFPVWDVLFGTYYRPEINEYPPTGTQGLRLESIWKISAYPFRQWIKKANAFLKGKNEGWI
jgi:sterol desaturase/sphingolipid hydroxylase (fatty acid hydroxylase superfamily)